MTAAPSAALPPVRLPDAPALVAGREAVVWLAASGEIETVSHWEAARRVSGGVLPLLCHGKGAARRLGLVRFPAYDVLELFAFVRPARFCVPTVAGLAATLLLAPPEGADGEAAALPVVARALLAELRAAPHEAAAAVAWSMVRAGWPWAAAVLAALGIGDGPPRGTGLGLKVWHELKEWEEPPPSPPPGSWPVEPVEARAQLVRLLGAGSEERPQQRDYASVAARAFAPRAEAGVPLAVLAEAGTGVGKTLGYLAAASVWAHKNKGPVWVSTYTRNLQRQLDRELDRLFPDLADKARKVVVRKGRENVLCLLNFDEALARLEEGRAGDGVALGLVARWIRATRDGDMIGGDFPGWLADLLGPSATVELTDTRGECIYGACRHYRKCFIERAIRKARGADIVVANHALVMVQTALGDEDQGLPTRYVFDEGHHLFEAADNAFSAHLTGVETALLRRWLVGPEDRRRGRGRGLSERLADLVDGEAAGAEELTEVLAAARRLPGPGWRRRLNDGMPAGPAETFLAAAGDQVRARAAGAGTGSYGLACDPHPASEALTAAADRLGTALARIEAPLHRLAGALASRLDDEAATLETAMRQRIDATLRGLDRRALRPLVAWRGMLASLRAPAAAATGEDAFIDWLGLERWEGDDVDVGLHRHWRDPTRPFIAALARSAHGVLVTSATLCDTGAGAVPDWVAAERRTGVAHLPLPAVRASVASPFDYRRLTQVFIVTDVARDDMEQVAAAFRELFLAAGGGGLGLFTAIARLRAVHARIAAALDAAGLPLYAQHVDVLDLGTLIDVFRFEPASCLLGTDAVRDGIDVPGRSLRLMVFDRVPWPRPDILHRERRRAFGGGAYDDMLTRMRLKQAYGRLVRRADDRGVFVMLDRALPSRLLSAFPDGVAVHRVGLAEVVAATRAFLEA
jgi:ATP-dependent DNA helicase DinG